MCWDRVYGTLVVFPFFDFGALAFFVGIALFAWFFGFVVLAFFLGVTYRACTRAWCERVIATVGQSLWDSHYDSHCGAATMGRPTLAGILFFSLAAVTFFFGITLCVCVETISACSGEMSLCALGKYLCVLWRPREAQMSPCWCFEVFPEWYDRDISLPSTFHA